MQNLLKLFLGLSKVLISGKTIIMSTDKERSSPVPKDDKESEQAVNQSTETRTQNSRSKLWIVIMIVIVFLLIILSITGVVDL